MMTPLFMCVVAPQVHVCVCLYVCAVGLEPLESLKSMQYNVIRIKCNATLEELPFFAANKMRDERERERKSL